jgi:hypothetical protein
MKVLAKAAPALVGLLAGAALVGLAYPALGRDDPPRAFASGAGAPHVPGVKAFTSKSSGLKIRYFTTQSTVQPGAEDGGSLTCPKKVPHAISGFFGPVLQQGVGQLALSDSFPEGRKNRTWDVGVKNLSTVPQQYFSGVVCVN